jgi:hypothetical protein
VYGTNRGIHFTSYRSKIFEINSLSQQFLIDINLFDELINVKIHSGLLSAFSPEMLKDENKDKDKDIVTLLALAFYKSSGFLINFNSLFFQFPIYVNFSDNETNSMFIEPVLKNIINIDNFNFSLGAKIVIANFAKFKKMQKQNSLFGQIDEDFKNIFVNIFQATSYINDNIDSMLKLSVFTQARFDKYEEDFDKETDFALESFISYKLNQNISFGGEFNFKIKNIMLFDITADASFNYNWLNSKLFLKLKSSPVTDINSSSSEYGIGSFTEINSERFGFKIYLAGFVNSKDQNISLDDSYLLDIFIEAKYNIQSLEGTEVYLKLFNFGIKKLILDSKKERINKIDDLDKLMIYEQEVKKMSNYDEEKPEDVNKNLLKDSFRFSLGLRVDLL